MATAFAGGVFVAGWETSAPRAFVLKIRAEEVNTNAASAKVVKNFVVIIVDQAKVESTTASELLPST